MLQRLTSKNFHSNYHLFVLLVLLVGVVCSKFLMSLGLMLGGLGFLLERDFKNYGARLVSNKLFLFVLAFYLLHFVGLLWSDNLDYGFNDIRVKFSLFAIVLIICSRPPLSKKQLTLFYEIFVLALVISSLVNFICYQFFQDKIQYIDIRDLSLFGSHIRFGILIALGIAATYFLWSLVPKLRWFWMASSFWLLFYTYFSQVLSGVLSVVVVIIVLLFWELYKRKKWSLIIGSSVVMIALKVGLIVYLMQPIKQLNHFPENYFTLRIEWNKHSIIPYDSLDLKKQEIKYTLERYLTSKNLPVSGDGILKLSSTDIRNIEKGYADINETKTGLMARLYGLRFQIHNSTNPSGHSLLERLEYWKTAISIIEKNWIIGVGTGDVNDSFLKNYKEINSPLTEERRLRAHNTYLTETVTFGVFGSLFFISMLVYFCYKQIQMRQLFGLIFMLVAIATFFLEDTLETQMGVTFFALFFGVFSRKIDD